MAAKDHRPHFILSMQTISIIVKGRVQGVFYRQSTREKARELGLTGYVQNMENGSVHIVATGEHEKLDQLIAWCRQGPPKAKVQRRSHYRNSAAFTSIDKFKSQSAIRNLPS